MNLMEFINLNETPRDIVKNPTDATSPIRGGIKGKSGNFNRNVRGVGEKNTNASRSEINWNEFERALNSDPALSPTLKALNNPHVVGGNVIFNFKNTVLPKKLLNHAVRENSNLNIILKAIRLRGGDEAVKSILSKMKELINKSISDVVDPEKGVSEELSKKEKSALLDAIKTLPTANSIESFIRIIQNLKDAKALKYVAEVHTKSRYEKSEIKK